MKHNVYFEGKVQSLGLDEHEGYATLGVIEPGAYTFSTSSEERMTIVAGSMRVRLPSGEWQEYRAEESFIIPHR